MALAKVEVTYLLIYLVDELSDADDVTLSVEDWQAEHRLRNEPVAVLQVLAEPCGNVTQI